MPLVSYQVGGALGLTENARYTLKVVVAPDLITLNFELGPEHTTGWNSWAPETEIPKIKASFRSVADKVALAVSGKLE
jgi:hypothetical protein